MIARLSAALARYIDGWRADREEHWGHTGERDGESIVRWLRRSNDRLGAVHARRFRQR